MTDITKKFINGSFLSVLNKSGDKIIGLCSTLILVRLLLPEDFGVIAITLMIINVTEALGDLGPANYIIQKKVVINSDVNTAWTLNLLIKAVISASIILLTPIFSTYFSTPSLTTSLPILALGMVIAGLASPKMLMMGRNMEYGIPFKISVLRKIISAAGTVIAAFTFRDYRALIVGHLLSTLSFFFLSYIFAYQKPSFTLANVNNQWDFSKWVVKSAVTGQLRGNIDTGFAAKFIGTAFVGPYQLMKYYASLPVTFFIQPILTPFIAALSKSKENAYHFNKQLEKVCLLMCSLSLSMFFVLYGAANTIVLILFGENWVEFAYIFKTFSCLLIVSPLSICFGKALTALGKVKSLFMFDIGSLALLVIAFTMMFLYSQINATHFIYLKVASDFLICLGLCIYGFYALSLPINMFWMKLLLLIFSSLLFYFMMVMINGSDEFVRWQNELTMVSIALLFHGFLSLVLFRTDFMAISLKLRLMRSKE